MKSTRLMILGLLTRTPQHGYEIQRWLEESRTETWAQVRPGSIYHALQQLQKEGFVQIQEITHTGHRAKAIYALTQAGRQEFQRLLIEAFRRPPQAFPAEFYTALTFLQELPAEKRKNLIDALIPKLEQEITSWVEGEEQKHKAFPLPAHLRALFANGKEHLEADLRLLYRLRDILSEESD
uniref:PadR family transcriptional regulator n=1 Tax=Thermosporothrix sp. COM3 TaxID=2490863 RepID=A0A455SIY2_9CHLR|nr:PadR family transcriptional regulator [Thermosporothrix sp. COM3]